MCARSAISRCCTYQLDGVPLQGVALEVMTMFTY